MVIFLENVSTFFWSFFGKNEKKFEVGKFRKNDEETELLEKKRFHLLYGTYNIVGGRKVSRR